MSYTNFKSAADPFSNKVKISDELSYKIYLILTCKLLWSASDHDYISYNFFKTMSPLIINMLYLIINTC